jgi:dolichol-phosphate mannosyltransferase
VLLAGGTVTEVPITFVEREAGSSKMSGIIIREALAKVTWWGVLRVFGRRRSAPSQIA